MKEEKELTFDESLELFFKSLGLQEMPETQVETLNILENIKTNAESNIMSLDEAHSRKKNEKMSKEEIDKYIEDIHRNELILYNARNYFIPRVKVRVKKEKEKIREAKRLETRNKIKKLFK